jgi:hypothetical protein
MTFIVRESLFEFEKQPDIFKSLRIGNIANRESKYNKLSDNVKHSYDLLISKGFTPEEIEMFNNVSLNINLYYFLYAKKTKKIKDLENFYKYLLNNHPTSHFSSIYSLDPHKFDDPKRAREIAREIILKDAKNETHPYTKGISKFFDRSELPVYFPNIEEFKSIDIEKEKGRTNLRTKSEEEITSDYSNAEKIISSSNYGQISSTPLQIKNGTIQFTTINGNKYLIQSSGYVRKILKGSERAAIINYDNQLSYEEMAQIVLDRINKEKKKSGIKEFLNFERVNNSFDSLKIGLKYIRHFKTFNEAANFLLDNIKNISNNEWDSKEEFKESWDQKLPLRFIKEYLEGFNGKYDPLFIEEEGNNFKESPLRLGFLREFRDTLYSILYGDNINIS